MLGADKVTIWIMPAVAAIIFAVLTAVSRYPHTFNYPVRITSENARRQYLLGRAPFGLAEGGDLLAVGVCGAAANSCRFW